MVMQKSTCERRREEKEEKEKSPPTTKGGGGLHRRKIKQSGADLVVEKIGRSRKKLIGGKKKGSWEGEEIQCRPNLEQKGRGFDDSCRRVLPRRKGRMLGEEL